MGISEQKWKKNIKQKKRLISELSALLVLAAIVVIVLYFCGVFSLESASDKSAEKATPPATTMNDHQAGFTEPVNTVDSDKTEIVEQSQIQNTDSAEDTDNSVETKVISLDMEYARSIEDGTREDCYSFTTSGHDAVYRLWLQSGKGPYRTSLILHDDAGFKVAEFDAYPSTSQEAFADLYLSANKQYTFTVSAAQAVDYKVCVSERICDAGKDQDSATEISLGVQHSAIANSTLSDWYVFVAPKTGKYILTFHNIDVGAAIKCDGLTYWGTAQNGDNHSVRFNADENDPIYFEIYSKQMEANGNYVIEIVEQLE